MPPSVQSSDPAAGKLPGVRSKELDRLLEVADELVDARAAHARMESLQQEIAHESAIGLAACEKIFLCGVKIDFD